MTATEDSRKHDQLGRTFIVWIDYGLDGWAPFGAETLEEALALVGHASGGRYVIARRVKLVEERPA